MKKLILTFVIIILISGCNNDNTSNNFSKHLSNVNFNYSTGEVEKLFNNEPNNIVIKNLIGKGEYQKAINKLEKKLSQKNTYNSSDIVDLIYLLDSYLQYGNSFYDENNYANKSLSIINKLPNYKQVPQIMYYFGYAHEIQKKYEKAINSYEIALNKANNNIVKGKIINQIGHVYDLQGNLQQAYDKYVEARKLNQDDTMTNLNVGKSLIRMGLYEKGKQYIDYALELIKNNNVLKSQILFDLGSLILANNGDDPHKIQKAKQYANLSINNFDKYPNSYILLAKIQMINNELEKAKKNINIALNLDNNNSYAKQQQGLLKLKQGNYDESLKTLNNTLDLIDKDIGLMGYERKLFKQQTYFNIARIYAHQNNLEQTINYLNKAIEGNKQNYYKLLGVIGHKESPFYKYAGNEQFQNQIIKKYGNYIDSNFKP